jgi:3-oxoacyl-[acyl-carrier protein] reductase
LTVDRLEGKVAVVTGAASGIGAATARLLAAHGAAVIVADIDRLGAERMATAIGAEGGQAAATHVDVGDSESFRQMLSTSAERWGNLHLLVNNAGVAMRRQPARDVSDDEWDRQIRLNLTSAWHGCRLVAEHLERAGGGAIVNVASLAAVKARPGFSAYTAAKAGLVALTKVLAQEMAPAIRVNSVSPVSTDTPMLPYLTPEGQSVDEFKAGMLAGIPLGRLNKPEDVAAAILYLSCDEAAMVTGHNLVVSGGAD